jgi:translation initiation factor IF-2
LSLNKESDNYRMAIRLIKIAKELNVGLSTIVEFLHSKGFEIESKPTAPVTEEMHQELLKEFQNAMAVKEMADQLIIGKRAEKDEPAAQKPKLKPLEKLPELVIPEEPKIEEEPIPEAVVEAEVETETASEPEVEEEKETKVEETVLPKVKVVGKIDLKPKKPKKKKKKEPEEPVVEEKEVVKEIEEVVETAPEEKEEAEKTVEEEMVKHDAPQLKGLKILGKIDSSKLKKPRKKKKEEPKPKPKTDKDKPTKGASKDKKTAQEEADKPKRRRKRKKITQRDLEKDRRSRRSKRKDEHKEISAKEIEERMKATMARLGGGGKHKRQKMRRDKRESIREKQEQTQLEKSMDSKLQVTEFISVSDLANLMDISPTQIITTCMNLGVIVSINQRLDAELIELLADEFGHEIEFISAEEQVDTEDEITDAEEDLEPRAPIVTVMGHVDHGKTSLLDYIREENVASGEAGGITQHIGAYEVQVGKDKKKITFLDTPGHEAFTAMRARGAKVTDIAVIIVAADDRIMPQTKEAISHAQAAGVPLVFAINKIDKPGADPERIKQELANMNLLVEDWGGKYQSQDISAKTGTNIAELLEKILLEAELLDLKANPNRRAYGTVIEASLDKGRGYVTKILIENGTLKIGDYILAGEHS